MIIAHNMRARGRKRFAADARLMWTKDEAEQEEEEDERETQPFYRAPNCVHDFWTRAANQTFHRNTTQLTINSFSLLCAARSIISIKAAWALGKLSRKFARRFYPHAHNSARILIQYYKSPPHCVLNIVCGGAIFNYKYHITTNQSHSLWGKCPNSRLLASILIDLKALNGDKTKR